MVLPRSRNRSRESVKFSEWPTAAGRRRVTPCMRCEHRRCVARRSRSSRCGRTRCRRALAEGAPVRAHQVEGAERTGRASSGGFDADEAGVARRCRAGSGGSRARRQPRDSAGRRRCAVASTLIVDVAGDDSPAPSAQRLHHGHRQRIRLLAGGGGVAPDARQGATDRRGAQVVRQRVEAMLLGKNEVRLVVRQLMNSATPRRRPPVSACSACRQNEAGARSRAGGAPAGCRPSPVCPAFRWDAGALVDQLAHAEKSAATSSNSWSGPSGSRGWVDPDGRQAAPPWVGRQGRRTAAQRPRRSSPARATPMSQSVRATFFGAGRRGRSARPTPGLPDCPQMSTPRERSFMPKPARAHDPCGWTWRCLC